jgi:hypothetical protein
MERNPDHPNKSTCHTVVFVTIVVFVCIVSSSPQTISFSDVWYTQIGQWHIRQNDSTGGVRTVHSGKSFLYHDSRIDGARSGQATANVRFNFAFHDIRRYEARIALGPAPATAGLLVQNKQVTYYFLVERGTTSDSLRICRYRDNRMISLFAVATKVSDTALITLSVKIDSLCLDADKTILSVAKPPEFSSLTAVGFECPQGSVKVFYAQIEAQNSVLKESFDKATLINLHLEKMLSGNGK